MVYVESSSLLSDLLEFDGEARLAEKNGGDFFASALTIAEARRVLARSHGVLMAEQVAAAGAKLDQFERRCTIVPITEAILRRVGEAFPVEPVRTLDAIHLATLLALGEAPETVAVLTRDRRIRANAEALGFEVI